MFISLVYTIQVPESSSVDTRGLPKGFGLQGAQKFFAAALRAE